MKTKKIVLVLIPTMILSVGIFSSVKNCFHSGKQYSDLLLLNIEALSQGDYGSDCGSGSDCSLGGPYYADVASISGECKVVQHFCDGAPGAPGTDQVYTMYYSGCIARGTGNYCGANYRMPTETGPIEYQTCTGNHYQPDF